MFFGQLKPSQGLQSIVSRPQLPYGHCQGRREAYRSFNTAQATLKLDSQTVISKPEFYLLSTLFPLGPLFTRATLRREVVPGKMWFFEQPQNLGGSNVTINVRMTVVRLKDGNLWVHAPIAPTGQCIKLLKELGVVKYIVLGTFAIEHKSYLGPFARRFPKAQVYVAPGQWSFPINLPLPFLGVFGAKNLDEDEQYPWRDEIDFRIFSPPAVGIGPYFECFFLHKATKSLIITDAVVKIPADPLPLTTTQQLLEAAKPNPFNPIQPAAEDTPENRLRGWKRMVLQTLYFGPEDLFAPDVGYEALKGKILVSPILRTLIFQRIPVSTKEFLREISTWNFTQIIPCHYEAPFKAGPKELVAAFDFLGGQPVKVGGLLPFGLGGGSQAIAEVRKEDLQTLEGLNGLLASTGTLYSEVED